MGAYPGVPQTVMSSELFCEHTPMEIHRVMGREVFVKREDLYGIPPCPPLAKLRGIRGLLARLYEGGTRLVGCWETGVSRVGEGVVVTCQGWPGMRTVVFYAVRKKAPEPECAHRIRELGSEIEGIPVNTLSVCWAQARRRIEARGGTMIPFGIECEEAVEEVAREAATIPLDRICGGTLVLCCGSGVTLAGLLRGLPVLPARIIGVSAGRSVPKIAQCIRRHVGALPSIVELCPAVMPYAHALEFQCPFPSHPHYDLKAWKHLLEHLPTYADPVLFWNIGS